MGQLDGEPPPPDCGTHDQHYRGPRDHGGWLGVVLLAAAGLLAVRVAGTNVAPWHGGVGLVACIALGGLALAWLVGQPRPRRTPATRVQEKAPAPGDALVVLYERAQMHGGGAFLGACRGDWVWADPEHAVLGLGPPRSGKSSCLVIPSLLACPGAAVSTSTKPDVMLATLRARARLGEVWLFDPTGQQRDLPAGVRRLCWSPVAGAGAWDEALLMARAMVHAAPAPSGTSHEQHWSERAAALLAPPLHAASLRELPISTVLRWVLRSELDQPGQILEDHGADAATDVLIGVVKTEARERSSIFSATAGVLSAYNSDAARAAAAHPNFDARAFVGSRGTVYVSAPAHRQAACAPLVLGLLEQLRHATYERSAAYAAHGRHGSGPVFFCLDELANIAPIPDLPALVSEGGGQGLHVLACLQDLSQARVRWGDAAADGLLSLFQTKLVFSGISDPRTLEAISLLAGEHDRQLVSVTLGLSRSGGPLFGETTRSESVTYNTQRQRTLIPGDIANLPRGRGLLIRGARCGLISLAPHYRTRPFDQLTSAVRAVEPGELEGGRAASRAAAGTYPPATVSASLTARPGARGLTAGRTA